MLNKVLISTPQQLTPEQRNIASSNIGAMRSRGSATVAELNALTEMQPGSMYDMTDAGTLTSFGSSVAVVAGDVVYLAEAGWKNLKTGSTGLSEVKHDSTLSGDGKTDDTALSVKAMTGATAESDGTSGIVPAPKKEEADKVLSGAGTWVDLPASAQDMTGASASSGGTHGLVPAPAAGAQGKVLSGAGTWIDIPNPQVMTGASSTQAGTSGLVPAPAAGNENKVLNGSGSWVNLPSEATSMTGATASEAGATGLVPAPSAGEQGKVLSGAGTWVNLPSEPQVMTGATASKAGTSGLVPAPAAGNENKVLSGAGTWVDQPSEPTKVSELGNDEAYIKDAPDTKTYGRKNGAWIEIAGATEGQLTSAALVKVLNEFPTDGNYILSVNNGVPGWIGSKVGTPAESVATGFDREAMTLTDSRDGHVYRCVSVGGRIWMAEPFQYEVDDSLVYDGHPEYGRYYTYEMAQELAPLGWELVPITTLPYVGIFDTECAWYAGTTPTNETGLTLKSSGYYYNGAFQGVGSYYVQVVQRLWSGTEYIDAKFKSPNNDGNIYNSQGMLSPIRYVLKQKYLYL